MGRDELYGGFAVLAAACAGWGSIEICWHLFGRETALTPLLGLAIGIGSLALMIRGVTAGRAARMRQSFNPAKPL